MKIKYRVLTALTSAILAVSACTTTNTPTVEAILDKMWVSAGYMSENNAEEFRLAIPARKPLDFGGFMMKSNGEFISYANSSFCGTPPIIYAEYPGGKWRKLNDSTYSIESAYWGTNLNDIPPTRQYLKFSLIILRQTPDQIVVRREYIP